MFAYNKTTPASPAKRLKDEAENVSWAAIAHRVKEVKSFLSRSDIKVYGDYVKFRPIARKFCWAVLLKKKWTF